MFMPAWQRSWFFVATLVGILGVIAAAACAPVAPPPAAPQEPALSVEPGTTQVTAEWPAVTEAAAYQVRWRPEGEDFSAGNLVSVTEPGATFDVAEQGLWVVRVQACNDAGCGRPGTATVPVIINISGHQAVRVWFGRESKTTNVVTSINVDWDALPGYYLVQYRQAGENHWVTSEPLTQAGYTLTGDSFADFEGSGHPIIRVFFNCNQQGKGCALLGRFPNNALEEVNFFSVPTDPYRSGAVGAEGAPAPTNRYAHSFAGQERDPLTHLLRPASDFTITSETRDDGITYRCVSRPAENPWETGMFGTADDAIKGCVGRKVIDHYELDRDAVFPDDAPCGYRPAADEGERREYGDRIKVCNRMVPLEDEADDDAEPEGSSAVGGQSHRLTHNMGEAVWYLAAVTDDR